MMVAVFGCALFRLFAGVSMPPRTASAALLGAFAAADGVQTLYERLKEGTTTHADRVEPDMPETTRILPHTPPATARNLRQQHRPSVCLRHPRACRGEDGGQAEAAAEAVRPPAPRNSVDDGTSVLAHTAAGRALNALSAGWCVSSEGCIASDWTASKLPRQLATSLLHAGKPETRAPTATACFDLSREDSSRSNYVALAACSRAAWSPGGANISAPVFDGEFGFELLHALPYLHWLKRCGRLGQTTACQGMAPFYFFSASGHEDRTCGTRPPRSHWLAGTMPRGARDGWSWAGRHSLQFYAYPSARWLPPPMHRHYRPLPLPSRPTGAGAAAGGAGGGGWRKRVWLQNKYYPEGHGTADNFWSLDELRIILDRLLGCGFQVVYNHPDIELLGATDVNDQGKNRQGYQLGDLALLRGSYASHLASGALLLLPELARSRWSDLGFNELQLRVVAKSRCFLAPQGGASYLTFYQPGLHIVNDRTGKERCYSALLASNGRAGTCASARTLWSLPCLATSLTLPPVPPVRRLALFHQASGGCGRVDHLQCGGQPLAPARRPRPDVSD